jgi:hypothetical protein
MNSTKWVSAVVLGLSFAMSATMASALAVGANGTIDIDANVPNVITATTSANVSGNASTNSNSRGTSGAQNANVSASDATNVSANVAANSVINLTRADLSAQASTGASVTSAVAVRSNDDLSAYANSLMKADANVSGVTLSSTAVSLTYQEPAKFFGFVPVTFDTTATVKGDGSATVSQPWYAVFASTNSGGLQSEVRAATAATVSANANASFSATTQAQLLAEIHQAMKTNFDSSVAAQGQASTSVQ